MYKEHKDLSIERAKQHHLWRYMDLWKFLKLINSSKLYFPNLQDLGDQNEGKIPVDFFNWMIEQDKKNGKIDEFPYVYKKWMDKHMSNRAVVNSWSAYDDESFALWKMYAKDKLGVAIKTDIDNLIKAFKDTEETIYISDVNYLDIEKRNYKLGSPFNNYITKNKYYEFESEVRCLILLEEKDDKDAKEIKVNLNNIIKEVYLSPFAFQTGLYDVIDFLKKKHKLIFKIKKSKINDNWL